jgi:hypothetical protein
MQAPDLGDAFAIAIFHYDVLGVLEGDYPHPIVLVGHEGADLSSPEFGLGVRHRLRLTRDFPEHSNLLNPFVREAAEFGVYFCRSFQVLNSPVQDR